METETKISHLLLQSSHDFITSAVKYANREDYKSLKFAILHLVSAFEVLFKSCLVDQHWSFIFSNLDKATPEKLNTGDFISADIETSINRLKNIINLELSAVDKDLIKKLIKIRNKIIHFHFDVSESAVRTIMAKGLNFYIEFYNKNISPNWEAYSEFGFKLSSSLTKFTDFVRSRMESLAVELKNSNRPKTNYFWECSTCLQDTIIVDEDSILKCLFCGQIIHIKDFAGLTSFDNKVDNCPKCKFESFVIISIKNENINYECLLCGYYIGEPQRFIDLNGNELDHLRTFKY